MRKQRTTLAPTPVETDVRICFGIKWFATEAEAMQQDAIERAAGSTYNGGYFDGMQCGRDTSFDKIVGSRKLYAVTF